MTKQRKLHEFLEKMEMDNEFFTLEELSRYTGYPLKASVKAKMSRGEWDAVIRKDNVAGKYYSQGVLGKDIKAFVETISSNARKKALNSAKYYPDWPRDVISLVEGSSEEFILALELFNRPSNNIRVSSFVTHFVLALEKLTKAKLIVDFGENEVTAKSKKRKTIPIRTVLDKLIPSDSNLVKLNFLEIVDLRDQAMHYFIPKELLPIASHFFQSAVINYTKLYKDFVGRLPIEIGGTGMLSIVIDSENTPFSVLQNEYGREKASEIVSMIKDYERKASKFNNSEYAIPIHASLGIVDKNSKAAITMSNLDAGKIVYVHIHKDPKTTHPFLMKEIVDRVNLMLSTRFNEEYLSKVFGSSKKFNRNHFIAIRDRNKWKDDNKYMYDHCVSGLITYSLDAVNFILNRIESDAEYLNEMKEWRQRKMRLRKG